MFSGGNLKHLLISAATIALLAHPAAAGAQAVAASSDSPVPTPVVAPAPPVPKGRAVPMALPLARQGALYGEILAEVYIDGTIRYDRQAIVDKLAPFLTTDGNTQLAAALPATPFVTPAEIEQAGVTLVYDASKLEVRIERIDPKIMKTRVLGDVSRFSQPPISLQPKDFSAYLNMIGDFRVEDFKDFATPAVVLQGAIRYQGFVLEVDGGFDKNLTGGGSGFYRRQARLVYDEYDKLRRWSAGDLQLNGLAITAGTLLGGVGIEKGRRVFVGSSPLIKIGGGQQFLLDRDATLDVIVEGQQAERLQLNAGSYDLSQLLTQYGGRNAQLFVTDVSGRRQLTSFDPYFDTSDLTAGETEYGAAVGFVPTAFRAQPIYGSDPAFSGYYRRGITNRLILGGSIQASADVQVAAVEVVIAPQFLSGRIEMSGAVSTGQGTGYALHGGVSIQHGYGPSAKQFSVSADYRDHNFSTLSDQIGLSRFRQFSINANYSQALGERMTLTVGGNYYEREGLRTTRLAFVDLAYRAERYRITAGVEYGQDTFGRTFGGRITLVVPLSRDTRFEAGYNSRRDDARLSVTKSYDNTVGSFGYDVTARRSDGFTSLEGSANYTGNRFYSRFTATTAGEGFSGIADRQDARLQIGSSIAFAGGSVAIGRPVSDSFVIAKPHEALAGKQVILGQSVEADQIEAQSGALGPALDGRLSSYNRQNFQYDLKGGTEGYDIGTGIHTVLPPYKSGYELIVGSDASVSAYGFLNVGGERANLLAGTIAGVDDPDYKGDVFFTNSAGRFAAQGLRPGKTYRVTLGNPPVSFDIKVPAEAKSLLQMGEVNVMIPGKGQE